MKDKYARVRIENLWEAQNIALSGAGLIEKFCPVCKTTRLMYRFTVPRDKKEVAKEREIYYERDPQYAHYGISNKEYRYRCLACTARFKYIEGGMILDIPSEKERK